MRSSFCWPRPWLFKDKSNTPLPISPTSAALAFKMKTSINKPTNVRVAIAFLLLLVASVGAEIKKFTFQGTISFVGDQGVLGGSVTNGSAFEGLYVFDTTAKDSSTDSTVGAYWYTNSAFGLVVKVVNFVFRTNPWNVDFLIEVVNQPGDDAYLLRSYNNIASQTGSVCSQRVLVEHILWVLHDSTGAALTNAFLPVTPPILSAWQGVSGLTVTGPGESFFLRGTVNSISEAAVASPEQFPVTLGDAVEVKWLSHPGAFYQIQSSEDLTAWTNVGESVLGDGTMLSRFVARQPAKNVFYRAAIVDFPR